VITSGNSIEEIKERFVILIELTQTHYWFGSSLVIVLYHLPSLPGGSVNDTSWKDVAG